MKKIIPVIKKALAILLFILSNAYCICLAYDIYKAYTYTPSVTSSGVFNYSDGYYRTLYTFEHSYIRTILFSIIIYTIGVLGLLWSFKKVRLKWFLLSILALIIFLVFLKLIPHIV